jgi:undecaprenol kinase
MVKKELLLSKNQSLYKRFLFAWNGLRSTFKQENSFKTEVALAVVASLILFFLKAEAIWWAIFLVLMASILALELVNTALENTLDRIHPEHHEQIGLAKDCAAAAIFLMSVTSVIIFIIFLYEKFKV